MKKTTIGIEKIHNPALLGPEEWSIVQLSKNRKTFIREVIKECIQQLKRKNENIYALIEELEMALYEERQRVQEDTWKVDPPDETTFWEDIKSKLVNISQNTDNESVYAVLEEILTRYIHEIAGVFKPPYYKFALRVAEIGFARLLNASQIRGWRSLWSKKLTLQDKIQLTGEVEHFKQLAKIGTVIMVPTHFSNLDPILAGWVIHILGLPPFIYGAGSHLFNIKIMSFFMDSLGAFKVDRRKKNPLYLEAVRTYTSLAIKSGCHTLFFPGGMRSRSGKIDKKLQLDLLGAAIDAQRRLFKESSAKENNAKIFIVPVALNYHFVLEAPTLINEYLEKKGQERYYVEKEEKVTSSYKIIKFLLKFFTKGSDISVSFGRGIDLWGNYVNEKGESLDKKGGVIDTRAYFISQDQITDDRQREDTYAHMLSKTIVKEYYRINRVFSSHLVAFTAFQILKKRYKKLDLYNLLRLPEDDTLITYDIFKVSFEKLRAKVFKIHEEGKINVAPHLKEKTDEVISHGLYNVGMYHAKRPLIRDKKGDILSKDLNVLYYYHNRLTGYGLENFI